MATATAAVYTPFIENQIVGPQVDFDNDTIKVMLVTSSYVYNEAHEFRSSITNEAVGDNYVAGGETITGITVSTVSNTTNVFGNNTTWASTGGTPFSFSAAVVYKDTGNVATDQLVSYHNFGTTLNNNGVTVELEWSTNALVAYAAVSIASELADLTDTGDTTPTNRNVLVADGVDWESRALTEADISDLGTYLTDVVQDTTPSLGGNLDVNGNEIVSAANGDIVINPNGTGNVDIGNFKFDGDQTVGAGQDNYVLTYDNALGTIQLEEAQGGSFPLLGTDGSAAAPTYSFASDPNTGLYWTAGSGAGFEEVVIAADGQEACAFRTSGIRNYATDGTIFLNIGATQTGNDFTYITRIPTNMTAIGQWRYPNNNPVSGGGAPESLVLKSGDGTGGSGETTWGMITDGEIDAESATDGYVLTSTGGSGVGSVAWEAIPASGISAVVEDIAPQLGGNLDVQTNQITTSEINGNITIDPNGTGDVILGNYTLDGDQTVGLTEDNYVLTYSDLTGQISLEPVSLGFPLAAPSGTAGTPSYNFSSSTGTGMFLNGGAGNTLSLSQGGNEYFRVASGTVNVIDGAGPTFFSVSAAGTSAGAAINFGTGNTGLYGGATSVSTTVSGTEELTVGQNQVTVTSDTLLLSAATGASITSATNQDITINPAGTGDVVLGNFTFDADQTVGAGQDNYVLTYDDGTGLISLEAAGGGGETYFAANYDGTAPSATGTDSLAIGEGAATSGTGSIAIGRNTVASSVGGASGIAIGDDAFVDSNVNNGIAIGSVAEARNNDGIAIGRNAFVTGNRGLAIGYGFNTTSFGTWAKGTGGVALGYSTRSEGAGSIALGSEARAGQPASGDNAVAVGFNADAIGTNSIAIGALSGNNSTAYSNTVTIGPNVTSTAANQMRIGTSATEFVEYTSSNLTLTGTNAQYVLPTYSVASAPTGTTGGMAYFTDGNAGAACVGVYDGANWKVVALGATISAT